MKVIGQRRQRPLGPADPRQPTAKRQGLDRQQLADLVRQQRGLCALCRRPLGASFVVDHDHQLAAQHGHNPLVGCRRCVRGILHTRCNSALGAIGDDPEALQRAAEYVTRLRRSY
jgi:hypothetical protein